VDVVINNIRDLLLQKKLLPGDKIPNELEIAEGLGVSRGSVREAMKILSGARGRVRRKITTIDMWENRYDAIDLPQPFADCSCCGRHEYPYMDGSLGAEAAALCGRNSVQIRPKNRTKIDFEDLAARLVPLGAVEQNRFLLRADIDGYQITIFSDGRAIIQGTYDAAIAKSLYSRYVGN
jgi:adenylyltransferase/sulfurtransferase